MPRRRRWIASLALLAALAAVAAIAWRPVAQKFREARAKAAHARVLRGEFREAIRIVPDDPRYGVILGTALFQSNDADAALAAHSRALQHARATGDRRLEAGALVGISRVHYHLQGRSADAKRNLERALRIARELRDPRIEGDALRHIGVIRWWFEGERETAIRDYCEPALAAYRKANDRHGEATVLNNIGLMHAFRGDFVNGMRFANDSLRIKEQIGDSAGMVDAWSALGDLYASGRHYQKARDLYLRCIETTERTGYRLAQNDVEIKLANIYIMIGELDPAVVLIERLAERELGNPLMLKYRVADLAEIHVRRGDSARALAAATRLRKMQEATVQPDLGFSYHSWMKIADVHRMRGELGVAEEAVRNADRFGVARDNGLYPNAVRAEIHLALGRPDQAIGALEDVAERDIRLLDDPALSITIEKPHHYDRVFRVLLGPGGDAALAARFLELMRYRSVLDVFHRTPRARPRPIDEIRAALDPGAAIIEYVIVERDVFAIVITRGGVRSVRLPIDGPALSAKVRLLRALLFERPSDDWHPVAADLRRVLIEPLALGGIRRLAIVPWGVLRDLPFAAFLVEDYTLSMLRSATAFIVKPEVAADGIAVCFAKRRFDDLPELAHAEEEGRAIAKQIGGLVRAGDAATKEELAAVASRARTIHFATHAVIEPDMPLLSRLELDRSVTVPDLLRLRFRGSLVTLGACRSGISNSWSGSDEGEFGRIGLVEALLHAGAGSVVATLAPVSDASAAAFMRSFYAEGVPGDPAGRLAVTQRALLARHPRQWAAFVVWQ